VSTRVDGAEPPVIVITARATLAAGAARLLLTVTSGRPSLNNAAPRPRRPGHANSAHRLAIEAVVDL
jgi:hypothetical protein